MDCQEVEQAIAFLSPSSDDLYDIQIDCAEKISIVVTECGTAIGLHAQQSEQQLHLNYPV
jgi:hypothetical protein